MPESLHPLGKAQFLKDSGKSPVPQETAFSAHTIPIRLCVTPNKSLQSTALALRSYAKTLADDRVQIFEPRARRPGVTSPAVVSSRRIPIAIFWEESCC